MEVTKMKYKQVVKLIIDIAMYLIFVALMQEHLWSDGLHEWLGITLFALFIANTILNSVGINPFSKENTLRQGQYWQLSILRFLPLCCAVW